MKVQSNERDIMPRKKQKDLADIASIVDDLMGAGSPGNGHDAEGLIDAEESGDVDELIEQTASRRPSPSKPRARSRGQGPETADRPAATKPGPHTRERVPAAPDPRDRREL